MYFKKIFSLASRALFVIFKTYSFLFPCAILFLFQYYPNLGGDHIKSDLLNIINQSQLDGAVYSKLYEVILDVEIYSFSSTIIWYTLFFLTIIQIVINITILLFSILKRKRGN